MNYIVLDLEWNQCPYGKEKENKKLPFEIIEIGAVKLNMEREITDTYHALVKPSVYHKIHFRTREVIRLSLKQLKDEGRKFEVVAREFIDWCGEEFRFCTFGTLDLTELQRNLAFYRLEELLKGPLFYEDVQKLFAIAYETRKDRRSLEYVVDYLGIEDNGEFHQALDDAVYTARALQRIPADIISRDYSIDCYQTPRSKEEEIRVRYENYEKFISREFASKEAVLEDREVRAVRCFGCGRNVKRFIPWFSDCGRNYFSIGTCEEHGYVKCKVRVRTAADGKFYAIKTTKLVEEAEVGKIEKKQRFLKQKRKRRGQEKA
ncbi:MAG: exonuclease domain-containing protein [Lachnospiraceae bacterium]|nr:exonuclease domain-containing protein [Lachnospiraceae bacterium]